ncbi:flavin reductase family protein [Micromonospora olivasterospora]|uniref:flavin reductase family protein n=1 Tax=Micromonospora olivasterospora TaxID=1880 RepID=UPI0031CDC50C
MADHLTEPLPVAAPADRGRALRTVLGSFATGVTVVAVGGTRPHAMTANSFTSVSLDPPLVLVCVDRRAHMHDRILAAGGFAVSVLARDQEHIARHFADRRRGASFAQFERVSWTPGRHAGAPLIDAALAWLECDLWRAYDGGDHSIVVGEVRRAHDRGAGDALIFADGTYRGLRREPPAAPVGPPSAHPSTGGQRGH